MSLFSVIRWGWGRANAKRQVRASWPIGSLLQLAREFSFNLNLQGEGFEAVERESQVWTWKELFNTSGEGGMGQSVAEGKESCLEAVGMGARNGGRKKGINSRVAWIWWLQVKLWLWHWNPRTWNGCSQMFLGWVVLFLQGRNWLLQPSIF